MPEGSPNVYDIPVGHRAVIAAAAHDCAHACMCDLLNSVLPQGKSELRAQENPNAASVLAKRESEDKVPDGVASLRRMRDKLCSNPRSRTHAPEFMAVITGNGEYARMVEDGIYAIPIRLLGK